MRAARKARLDPTPRDVRFKPGDEVLLGTTFLSRPLPSRDKQSPRWMGPFRVLEQTAPNRYKLNAGFAPPWLGDRSSTTCLSKGQPSMLRHRRKLLPVPIVAVNLFSPSAGDNP